MLEIRRDAAADIAAAKRWYEEQRVGLGPMFEDDTIAVIRNAVSSPLQHPLVFRRTHRALLNRFPYAVYYRLTRDTVVVVAVMHTRRHPRTWQAREGRPAYGPELLAA